MELIVGLGNPGEEYDGSWHNLGFEVVDALRHEPDKILNQSKKQLPNENDYKRWLAEHLKGEAPKKGKASRWKKQYQGRTSKLQLTPAQAKLLLKPTTYMNVSGVSVNACITNEGLDVEKMLVIHDDLDIEAGRAKLQFGRGAAGHKGVQSIVDRVGSKQFWRLRVGIGKPKGGIDGTSDYVLDKIPESEHIGPLSLGVWAVAQIWNLGFDKAMQEINRIN